MQAAKLGQAEMVFILLSLGANPNLTNNVRCKLFMTPVQLKRAVL